jgi:hypothetical protein
LVSFIVHPDYIMAKRPRDVYLSLLEYLARLRCEDHVWFALPGEVNAWWRARANMKLVFKDDNWCIEGPGSERARLAFAKLEGSGLAYTFANYPTPRCIGESE